MRLLVLIGTLLFNAVLACAAGSNGWHTFKFDGSEFSETTGPSMIAIRDGYLPALSADRVLPQDPLPDGTGGVALLCYQQVSGGKLKRHSGFVGIPGVAVTVHGAVGILATRSDASGYLILALPAGTYEFKAFGFSKRINVVQGKNSLVSIRGGKRMVD